MAAASTDSGPTAGDEYTLHPFLESLDHVGASVWYVLANSVDDAPTARLGHSCTPTAGGLLLFAGADPGQAYNDVFVLDTRVFQWRRVSTPSPPAARYDHTAVALDPTHTLVLGGAAEAGNLDDVYLLTLVESVATWQRVTITGPGPSARTMRFDAVLAQPPASATAAVTAAAAAAAAVPAAGGTVSLCVFGGGLQGMSAVLDTATYVLTVDLAGATGAWQAILAPTPAPSWPSPRMGHSLTTLPDGSVLLFGGMHETTFFDELWRFVPATQTWAPVEVSGDVAPCARSGHAAAVIGHLLYVHGGLGLVDGVPSALDDLFVLDTQTLGWSRVSLACAPVPARLDHTLCAVTIMAGRANSEVPTVTIQPTATPAATAARIVDITTQLADTKMAGGPPVAPATAAGAEPTPVLVLYGGVDLAGTVFDDCYLLRPALSWQFL